MKIINYILTRLSEPSTWRGLIALLGVTGVALAPEQKEAIIGAGVSLIALINIFKKDAASPDAKSSNSTTPPQT